MKKVEQRVAEEVNRVDQYLQPRTLTPLLGVVDTVLIIHQQDVITGEFESLLHEYRITDLTRMYTIVSRVPSTIPQMQEKMESFIATTGTKSLSGVSDPRSFVEVVIQTYRKYRFLVDEAFKGDMAFEQSLDRACRRFINRSVGGDGSSLAPELVARYSDQLLKKTGEKQEESTREETLNDIMMIFKYLEEKDAFMTFYGSHLSSRLINNNSFSEHLEDHMIRNLKTLCGIEHTASLKAMFNDMKVSKGLQEEFKSKLEGEGKSTPLDFTALVLVKGIWPLKESPCSFSLSPALNTCREMFEKFYQSKYPSRSLRWVYHYSKGEVKLTYTPKQHILQCSAYQMGVLDQFNRAKVLSKAKLKEITTLDDGTLDKVLKSLVKTRVVNMKPKLSEQVPDTLPDHLFCLNQKFTSDSIRLNINIKSTGEKANNNIIVRKQIEESRRLEIQACIVRVMKAKKKLEHRLLVAEVMEQLGSRFEATVSQIKRCIDILIEKDYLERNNDKGDSYNYVS
eukprot:CAMPEP_0201512452 /NCGR_PEP_ID=MMETSP0161_2-20130828/4710_1 /ASSEMBLY_ACC=CAM_ASM_000251 /TAXON_ID=180227 /ORGANISM="Neoparamoeba aestuarina, Strain SoJaBio B1-5/56/2" /LENGTH=509 /DNA_ID=CAMNT_0047908315 /DNA_START=837 /DNA_END=2366 /DNA_ORIENTATION=+